MMYIDNTPIGSYNAKLLDFIVGETVIKNICTEGVRNMYPRLLSSEIGTKTLEITMDVYGRDTMDTARSASRLTAALSLQVNLHMPDDFYYRCILTGMSSLSWKGACIATRSYTFLATQHLALVKIPLNGLNTKIQNLGTAETECRIEFTPDTALEDITVVGVTVRNVVAGVTVVIDGFSKTITAGGNNKFLDCDLIEFPRIRTGECEIVLSKLIPCSVQYYPTFV